MTTAISTPRVWVDFCQRPATFAQTKFFDKTWDEAYAYITAIYFAVIALGVNALFYAEPLLEVVVANAALFAVAYFLVIPFIVGFFADARKAQRQGEKEMIIDAKMTELQRLDNQAFATLLNDRGIQLTPGNNNTDASLYLRSSSYFDHKLARVIYYENRATALTNTSALRKAENKFVESAEAELAAAKAKVKAAFYASLITVTTHGFTKFNDAFTWSDMSIADRLARRAANHHSGHNLLERKGDARKVLSDASLSGSLGEIGRELTGMLPNRPLPVY